MKRFGIMAFSVLALLLPLATFAADHTSSMHPVFPLLDADARPVSAGGQPPDSVATCGSCHDAGYINRHNSHFNLKIKAGCIECHWEGSRIPTDGTVLDEKGLLRRDAIRISSPRDANCAYCHGLVHSGKSPLSIPGDYEGAAARYELTRNSGAVVSAQNISDSLLNLENKAALDYPWDVHSARMVGCTACHHASNNPSKAGAKHGRLDFLVNDPRRISTSEYLKRPNHTLSAAGCTVCHDPLATHEFLPYRERHFEVLSCESCHISSIKGPALKSLDATSLTEEGAPLLEYRGADADGGQSPNTAFSTGFSPFLFAAEETGEAGKTVESGRITPFNLVTEWRWVSGADAAQVPVELLQKVFLDDGKYRSRIIKAFDGDGDASLSKAELRLDSPEKTALIKKGLEDLVVDNPRIAGRIIPHAVRHGVMPGQRVKKDCGRCHARESDLNRDVPLSAFAPAGVRPELPGDGSGITGGVITDSAKGLLLKKAEDSASYYVFGHTRAGWSDLLGLLSLAAVVAGVMLHGGYRIYTRRKRKAIHGKAERVYLYSAYERIWHWVMAFSVLVLLVSGLQIHFTGNGRSLSLFMAVNVHNFFAVLLAANAFLSLFYHLAGNAIRQFIPSRENLKGQVRAQIMYYLNGIFTGQPHPTQESAERKLNVLQQITYLLLLNVLLPMQILSGVLIWGVSRWPDLASELGGLFIVAPLHNLGSWLFLSFFVLHVYLTTTGRSAFSNIRAMIDGYKDIETSTPTAQGGCNG